MLALRAVVPVSQMLFGTDWPHLTTEEHVIGLRNCAVFDEAELQAHHREADEPESRRQLDQEGSPRRGMRRSDEHERREREKQVDEDPAQPGQRILHDAPGRTSLSRALLRAEADGTALTCEPPLARRSMTYRPS